MTLGVVGVPFSSSSSKCRHFHRMCSAKKLTLLFLYSSLPGQPSSQPATQPAIKVSTIPLPSQTCPEQHLTGNLQESSGLVRLWHDCLPK